MNIRLSKLLLPVVIAAMSMPALSAASGGVLAPGSGEWKTAVASFYGAGQYSTASGRSVDSARELFVAHKKLPFGTRVRFRRGKREVVATVLDRGPFVAGRSWDLSYLAAKRLGLLSRGVGKVQFRVENAGR